MPGLARVSRSRSGLLPPTCHPHACCCTAPPSSDSPRALRWRQEHLARRGPAPSCGGAAGRQRSPLPGESRRTRRLPVSSGLCLWGSLGSGAPVMSTHSHYLFLHRIRSGQALPHGAPGSSPTVRFPPCICLPLSTPTSSGFRLASRQHAGPSHAMGRLGLLVL